MYAPSELFLGSTMVAEPGIPEHTSSLLPEHTSNSGSSSVPVDAEESEPAEFETILDEIFAKTISSSSPPQSTSYNSSPELSAQTSEEVKPSNILVSGMRRSSFDSQFAAHEQRASHQTPLVFVREMETILTKDSIPTTGRTTFPPKNQTSRSPNTVHISLPSFSPIDPVPLASTPRAGSIRNSRPAVAPAPSKFCHLCSRTQPLVRAICSNIEFGRCKKSVCRACFAEHPEWNWEEATAPGSRWECPHCTSECSRIAKARCAIYKRVNEKRRKARIQKKAALLAAASGKQCSGVCSEVC